MRSVSLSCVWLLCGVVGCSQAVDQDVPADDATLDARVLDAPIDNARPDLDGDGLCDDTERILRTDINNPDTDGDGLTDLFEWQSYYSPLSATDPPARDRLAINERPGSEAVYFMEFAYTGMGTTLTGVLLEGSASVDGRTIVELGGTMEALSVTPPSAVAGVSGSTFAGLTGRARLRWELRFRYPGHAPLGCRRAYRGYVSAISQGEGFVYGRPLVLDVSADPAARSDGGAGTDAAVGEDASTGPLWPLVNRGFCMPEPGFCN